MSFRREEKLLLSHENILDFKNYLKENKAKNIYNKREIESLYFDNSNLDMFSDSEEGLLPRKKIRIRGYPNQQIIKFYKEIKISSDEGRFKINNEIEKKDFEVFKNSGIYDNQYGLCMPIVSIKYIREYYAKDDFRVTIDTNITYKNYKSDIIFNESKVVAELKASAGKDLDELMTAFPIQRTRFSKYCCAINSMNLS